MSKWENLSDFEINSAVHNILKCGGKYSLKFIGNDCIEWECGDNTITTEKIPYGKALKDYCNSWTDAGEIIKKCGISLIKLETLWMAITSGSGIESYLGRNDDPCLYGEGFEFKHENPLRAVAVLFLIMNEDKGNE